MAERPQISTEINSTIASTIAQPTTKLGGRGTPRRKVRRSNVSSTTTTNRFLENKLKIFRFDHQLDDFERFDEVEFFYEDGRVQQLNNYGELFSNKSMTIHQIQLDEALSKRKTSEEFQSSQINPNNRLSSYTHSTLSSSAYINQLGYQENPYSSNLLNNIKEIYGCVNAPSIQDDDVEQKVETTENLSKSSRRRRRRKTTNQQVAAETSEQIVLKNPAQTLSTTNDPDNPNRERRRRRRQRRKTKQSVNCDQQEQEKSADFNFEPINDQEKTFSTDSNEVNRHDLLPIEKTNRLTTSDQNSSEIPDEQQIFLFNEKNNVSLDQNRTNSMEKRSRSTETIRINKSSTNNKNDQVKWFSFL